MGVCVCVIVFFFWLCGVCVCVLICVCGGGFDSSFELEPAAAHATKQSVNQSSRTSVCFLAASEGWVLDALFPYRHCTARESRERRNRGLGRGSLGGPGTLCRRKRKGKSNRFPTYRVRGLIGLVRSKPTGLFLVCNGSPKKPERNTWLNSAFRRERGHPSCASTVFFCFCFCESFVYSWGS